MLFSGLRTIVSIVLRKSLYILDIAKKVIKYFQVIFHFSFIISEISNLNLILVLKKC
jgi:hypothetical protein